MAVYMEVLRALTTIINYSMEAIPIQHFKN